MKFNKAKITHTLVQKLPVGMTRKVGNAGIHIQKASPQILFGVGVVGLGATVYLASKATLKAPALIESHMMKDMQIEEVYEDADIREKNEYTENDYRRDKRINMMHTCVEFARLYSPAFLVGAATIAAFAGGQIVLNKRNAGLVAAYATIEKAFESYRERVIDEYGEDKDAEFRYDMVQKTVKDSEGKKTKTMVVSDKSQPSMYARIFDEYNKNWVAEASVNRAFLSNVQNHMNDLLRLRGHLFLNEVYDALGFERTPAGSVTGWIISKDGTDNFVDFGIFNDEWDISKRMFINGEEPSVLLDFNVNGTVYDLI